MQKRRKKGLLPILLTLLLLLGMTAAADAPLMEISSADIVGGIISVCGTVAGAEGGDELLAALYDADGTLLEVREAALSGADFSAEFETQAEEGQYRIRTYLLNGQKAKTKSEEQVLDYVNTSDTVINTLFGVDTLIIGEGVGEGEVTLDGVSFDGAVIAHGGGSHSIRLTNCSNVGNLIIAKSDGGALRIYTEEGSRVNALAVEDGNDEIIVEGSFQELTVRTDVPVVIQEAVVSKVSVEAASAQVTAAENAKISVVSVPEASTGAAVTVNETAKIAFVDTKAEAVAISGEGKITQVTASGSGTTVNTTQQTVVKATVDNVTVGAETLAITDAAEILQSAKEAAEAELDAVDASVYADEAMVNAIRRTAKDEINAAAGSEAINEALASAFDALELLPTAADQNAVDTALSSVAAIRAEIPAYQYESETAVRNYVRTCLDALLNEWKTEEGLQDVKLALTEGEYQASVDGTENHPEGKDGSFRFRVRVFKGMATADSENSSITILATPMQEAPGKPMLTEQSTNSLKLMECEGLEYRIDGGEWQTSGEFNKLKSGTQYRVEQRVQAVEGKLASAAVLKRFYTMPEAPTEDAAVISYAEERIEVPVGMELLTKDGEPAEEELDAYMGETLLLRIAEKGECPPSEALLIAIPQRPAMPALTAGTPDESGNAVIAGLTTAMELAEDEIYRPVTEADIAALPAGNYLIRLAATEQSFASAPALLSFGTKRAVAASEAELIEAVKADIESVDSVQISGDIVLTTPLRSTKQIIIPTGSSLTVADAAELGMDACAAQPKIGGGGRLRLEGTLFIDFESDGSEAPILAESLKLDGEGAFIVTYYAQNCDHLEWGLRQEWIYSVEIGNDLTLDRDLCIPAGATLRVGDGRTLTVPVGTTLTADGTLSVEGGALVLNGTIDGEGWVDVYPSDTKGASLTKQGTFCHPEQITVIDFPAKGLYCTVSGADELEKAAFADSTDAINTAFETYSTVIPVNMNGADGNMQLGTVTVPAGKMLILNGWASKYGCEWFNIPVGCTLTVEDGGTLLLHTKLNLEGTLINRGVVQNNSFVNVDGTLINVGPWNGNEDAESEVSVSVNITEDRAGTLRNEYRDESGSLCFNEYLSQHLFYGEEAEPKLGTVIEGVERRRIFASALVFHDSYIQKIFDDDDVDDVMLIGTDKNGTECAHTLTESLCIPPEKRLSYIGGFSEYSGNSYRNSRLIVPEGVTLTVDGELVCNRELENHGTVIINGFFRQASERGHVSNDGSFTVNGEAQLWAQGIGGSPVSGNGFVRMDKLRQLPAGSEPRFESGVYTLNELLSALENPNAEWVRLRFDAELAGKYTIPKTMVLDIEGSLTIPEGGSLTVNGVLNVWSGLINAGSVQVSSGGELRQGGEFQNDGTLTLNSGSSFYYNDYQGDGTVDCIAGSELYFYPLQREAGNRGSFAAVKDVYEVEDQEQLISLLAEKRGAVIVLFGNMERKGALTIGNGNTVIADRGNALDELCISEGTLRIDEGSSLILRNGARLNAENCSIEVKGNLSIEQYAELNYSAANAGQKFTVAPGGAVLVTSHGFLRVDFDETTDRGRASVVNNGSINAVYGRIEADERVLAEGSNWPETEMEVKTLKRLSSLMPNSDIGSFVIGNDLVLDSDFDLCRAENGEGRRYRIAEGITVTVPWGCTLSIENGCELVVDGRLLVEGNVNAFGGLDDRGNTEWIGEGFVCHFSDVIGFAEMLCNDYIGDVPEEWCEFEGKESEGWPVWDNRSYAYAFLANVGGEEKINGRWEPYRNVSYADAKQLLSALWESLSKLGWTKGTQPELRFEGVEDDWAIPAEELRRAVNSVWTGVQVARNQMSDKELFAGEPEQRTEYRNIEFTAPVRITGAGENASIFFRNCSFPAGLTVAVNSGSRIDVEFSGCDATEAPIQAVSTAPEAFDVYATSVSFDGLADGQCIMSGITTDVWNCRDVTVNGIRLEGESVRANFSYSCNAEHPDDYEHYDHNECRDRDDETKPAGSHFHIHVEDCVDRVTLGDGVELGGKRLESFYANTDIALVFDGFTLSEETYFCVGSRERWYDEEHGEGEDWATIRLAGENVGGIIDISGGRIEAEEALNSELRPNLWNRTELRICNNTVRFIGGKDAQGYADLFAGENCTVISECSYDNVGICVGEEWLNPCPHIFGGSGGIYIGSREEPTDIHLFRGETELNYRLEGVDEDGDESIDKYHLNPVEGCEWFNPGDWLRLEFRVSGVRFLYEPLEYKRGEDRLVGTEEELRQAADDEAGCISLSSDITLYGNLRSLHELDLNGHTLTVAPEATLVLDGGSNTWLNGTLVNEGNLEIFGGANVDGSGTLENRGRLVNGGDIRINGGCLMHGGTHFENSGNITLRAASFVLENAEENSFINTRYMKVIDVFSEDGIQACKIDYFHLETVMNLEYENSCWIDFTAEVTDFAGLQAAETEQATKNEALEEMRQAHRNEEERAWRTGLEVYNRLDFADNITVSDSVTLSGFGQYWMEQNETGGHTLTVAKGGTLRIGAGNYLNISNESRLINNGTLVIEAEQPEQTDQNGNRIRDYIGCAVLDLWPGAELRNAGGLENGGELSIRHEWNIETKKFDHFAAVEGIQAVNGIVNTAHIHSESELLLTAAETSGFGRLIIRQGGSDNDGNHVELNESLSIGVNLEIEPNSGLLVKDGVSLTLTDGCFFRNDGDMQVDGALTVGKQTELRNQRQLVVGQPEGGSAVLTVDGVLQNDNELLIRQTGVLQVNGFVNGRGFDMFGSITMNRGTMETEWINNQGTITLMNGSVLYCRNIDGNIQCEDDSFAGRPEDRELKAASMAEVMALSQTMREGAIRLMQDDTLTNDATEELRELCFAEDSPLTLIVSEGVTLTVGEGVCLNIYRGQNVIAEGTIVVKGRIHAFGGLDDRGNVRFKDGGFVARFPDVIRFAEMLCYDYIGDAMPKGWCEFEGEESEGWPVWDGRSDAYAFLVNVGGEEKINGRWEPFRNVGYADAKTILSALWNRLTEITWAEGNMPALDFGDVQDDWAIPEEELRRAIDSVWAGVQLPKTETVGGSYALFHNEDEDRDYIVLSSGKKTDNTEVRNLKFTSPVSIACTDESFRENDRYGGTIRFRNCEFGDVTVYYHPDADFTVEFEDSCVFGGTVQVVAAEGTTLLDNRRVELRGVRDAKIIAYAPCEANTNAESGFVFNGVTVVPAVTGNGDKNWTNVCWRYHCCGRHDEGFNWEENDHRACTMEDGSPAAVETELQLNTGRDGILTVSGRTDADKVCVAGRVDLSALTAARIELADWVGYVAAEIGPNTVVVYGGGEYEVSGSGTVLVRDGGAEVNGLRPHIFGDMGGIYLNLKAVPEQITLEAWDAVIAAENYVVETFAEDGSPVSDGAADKVHISRAENAEVWIDDVNQVSLSFAVDGLTYCYERGVVRLRAVMLGELGELLERFSGQRIGREAVVLSANENEWDALRYDRALALLEGVWDSFKSETDGEALPEAVSLEWARDEDLLDWYGVQDLSYRLCLALGFGSVTVSDEEELFDAIHTPYVAEIHIPEGITVLGTFDDNDNGFDGCFYLNRNGQQGDLNVYIHGSAALTVGGAEHHTKLDIGPGVNVVLIQTETDYARVIVSEGSLLQVFGNLDVRGDWQHDDYFTGEVSVKKRLGDFGARLYERLLSEGLVEELSGSDAHAGESDWPDNEWERKGMTFLADYAGLTPFTRDDGGIYWPTWEFAEYGQALKLMGAVYERLKSEPMPGNVCIEWNPGPNDALDDGMMEELIDAFLEALSPGEGS